MAKQTRETHRWKFYRAGGLDQVVLRDGADVVHLPELDQKLWVALACPTRGLEFDARTLDLLDTDHDGRIRAPEVIEAIRWVAGVLRDPEQLVRRSDTLALDAIAAETAEGAAVLASARRLLGSLGKGDAAEISLADVLATERIFSATNLNGDGIVPLDVAPDEAVRGVLADVMATHGSVPDRSGKDGVDAPRVEAFFAEAKALAAWAAAGEADPAVHGLGAAAAAVAAVERMVDDYFVRCRLAAFDPEAAPALSPSPEELRAVVAQSVDARALALERLPLARIEPGRPLPLAEGVNPAWAGALGALATDAVSPLLGPGRATLSETEWAELVARVAPHRAWLAAKPATAVEPLGLARVQELVAGPHERATLDLVAADAAVRDEIERIESLERLLRLTRDLVPLLENFVSFSAFYARRRAVFQIGTLYLDGRSCDLCVRVDDAAKHATLAGLAKTYLAYCDCVRPATGERMTIAAAFTDGDSDRLMVGRNGLFYDRQGRDWDATVVRLIENPISVRQAFWSPYKRFVRMIEEQVAKRAAAADTDSTSRLATTAQATVAGDAKAVGDAAPKKMDIGTVAAIGVAAGSIGGILSTLLTKFIDLGMWIPLGVVGLVLAISGPSVLIAWLKLRQRNLGPILDANGWAVNGEVKITVPFGAALTQVGTVPPGAERSLVDPYAEKRRPWRRYLVLLVLLGLGGAWYLGRLDPYLPEAVRATTVLGRGTPAAVPPTGTPAPAPAVDAAPGTDRSEP